MSSSRRAQGHAGNQPNGFQKLSIKTASFGILFIFLLVQLTHFNHLNPLLVHGEDHKDLFSIALNDTIDAPSAQVDRPKYLEFLLCGDFVDQLEAFKNGVALAYMLNMTMVLPKWYAVYKENGYDEIGDYRLAKYDPQHLYAVDVSYFFRSELLEEKIKNWVKVVKKLPEDLESPKIGSYLPIRVYNMNVFPREYYLDALRNSRVLRLNCPQKGFTWDSREHGRLRRDIEDGLVPNEKLKLAIDNNLGNLRVQSTRASVSEQDNWLLGVHIPSDLKLQERCALLGVEKKDPWMATMSDCYKDFAELADFLAGQQWFDKYPSIYVASRNFTEENAKALLQVGFSSVAAASFSCSNSHEGIDCSALEFSGDSVLESAVEYYTLLSSDMFIGNVFSILSTSIRLTRLGAQSPVTHISNSQYYNLPPELTSGDVAPEEVLHHNVCSGILHPEIYDQYKAKYAGLLDKINQALCMNHLPQNPSWCFDDEAATVPYASAVVLSKVSRLELEKLIEVQGYVTLTSAKWFPEVAIMVNNKKKLTLQANYRLTSDNSTTARFHARLPYTLKRVIVPVEIKACTAGQNDTPICSEAGKVALQPPLVQQPPQNAPPLLHIHLLPELPNRIRLYMLHVYSILQSLYARKEISVYPVLSGNAPHRKQKKPGRLWPTDLSPQDYVLVHELDSTLDPWWPTVFRLGGAIPVEVNEGQNSLYGLGKLTSNFSPFKQLPLSAMRLIRSWSVGMGSSELQLWRYFQDDVHFIIPAMGERQGQVTPYNHAVGQIADIFIQAAYPFSTSEISTYDVAQFWRESTLISPVSYDVHVSQIPPEYGKFEQTSVYIAKPHAMHYRDYVLLLPPNYLPVHKDLAASLYQKASQELCTVVIGPQGSILLQRSKYYKMLEGVLDQLVPPSSLESILVLIKASGGKICQHQSVFLIHPGNAGSEECTIGLINITKRLERTYDPCFCEGFLTITQTALWKNRVKAIYSEPIEPFVDKLIQRILQLKSWCMMGAR